MRNKRILILDDDGDYRKLLLAYLGGEFKNIDLVEYDPVDMGIPGSDFEWSDYDVLLLDYDLRSDRANGLDILEENKDNPDFPATIMLTGAGSEEVAVMALKSGVSDYFRKHNLKKEQLLDSIRNIFTRQQLHKERTYTMEEAQKAAKAEAMKIIFAFRTKYDRLHKTEMDRLQAEKARLQQELKESKKIFEQLGKAMHVGDRERDREYSRDREHDHRRDREYDHEREHDHRRDREYDREHEYRREREHRDPAERQKTGMSSGAKIHIPGETTLNMKNWQLEPVENLKQKQENAEADLKKVNWKIQREDEQKEQFIEDISLFRRESRSKEVETAATGMSEEEKRARVRAAESAREKYSDKQKEQSMLDDISSQLKKD